MNTPLHIREAAKKTMDEGFINYTSNAGLLSLRKAISRRMKRQYKTDIPIDRVVVSAGAVSALNISLLSIVDINEEGTNFGSILS